MSQAIFPTLSGLMWDVKKTPQWSTKVQQSTSGKELRASYYSYPIYKYELSYEVLRQATAFQELQTLLGFFNARQGKYDSFLFQDPNDNAVTAMGFGAGDGATIAFQLQRTAAGPRQADSVSGVLPIITTPRENWALWTEQFDNAAWAKTNCTVGVNAVLAPDASVAADLLTPTASSGGVTQNSGVASANQSGVYSVWLRADTPHTATIKVQDSVSFNGAAANVNVTTQWQRFSVFSNWSGAETGVIQLVIWPGTFGGGFGSAQAVAAWGAQLELGGTPSATTYIANNSGAGRIVSPAYWPAQGDGFEPVYDLNAVAQLPQIFVQGTLKTLGTDYTISPSGLVTFTSAPGAGLALTWTGSYFWRCRFDIDAADFNEFLYQLWELKQLTLVTVK